MTTTLLFALAVTAAAAPTRAAQAQPPALPQDSVKALVRKARRAETRYELLARIRAPVTFRSDASDHCDEIVGRFCLTFDPHEGKEPPRPEPADAVKARDTAISALDRAARAAPADERVARGLVRLLVEAQRDSAAVEAARRYAAATPGLWADLLLGFALHGAGDDTAAIAHFTAALPELSERERRRLRVDALVSPEEKSAVHHLDPAARAGYEAALWKLSDPLYLTPGNEALGEHLARYVWTRMMAELPLVRGMTSWGSDLDELTFRYGVPTSRERIPAEIYQDHDDMVEHYDPAQLAFLPESLLTAGVRPTPPPGAPWALEDARARSGYAPATVRRVLPLTVQLTRFPAGDSVVLRIDGAVALDSAARSADSTGDVPAANGVADRGAPDAAAAGLFILPSLDSLLRGDTALLRAVRAPATIARDTCWLALGLTLPPGRYVYSAELLERRSRLAARARYRVELSRPSPPGTPALSDVLVARAFEGKLPNGRWDSRIRALPEAAAAPGDTLGLYAEVSGLQGGPDGGYRVELALSRTGAPPPPVRAWTWLRERLGGSPPSQGVSLAWNGQLPPRTAGSARDSAAAAPVVLATDLVVPRLSPGLYTLRLRVVDGATGAAAASDRALLVRRRPR